MVADVTYLEQSLQNSQQQLSQLESSFARQRQAFKANPMPSAEQRIQWLKALAQLLSDSREPLVQAISQDFSNRSADETLLAELMRNADRVMTRTMLLERVWDFDFDPRTNIVETHLSRLRAKLNAGGEPDPIETLRGAGYRYRSPQ